MSNSFGSIFKITTFGESHGKGIGCIIDNCPAGFDISETDIQVELDLRRPGQSHITTDRDEGDVVEIMSGIYNGKTTGTPIALFVKNNDQRSNDYSEISSVFRPSHADFTYEKKYGIRDPRGGGRTSARETIARVAAGAIAKKILKTLDIEILSFVSEVYDVVADIDIGNLTSRKIFSNIVRCPDIFAAEKMIKLIEQIKSDGDSLGGVVSCLIKNPPIGIGSPVFNKLHANLANAMMGINAVKGFEIGDGFACTRKLGSENNDQIVINEGKAKTVTNHSGGINGGISNGEDIFFRVAFKPVSTIKKAQKTINSNGEEVILENVKGRHDPCVLPRAVPIVSAMASLVFLDQIMLDKALKF
jgi:chorismate synthase